MSPKKKPGAPEWADPDDAPLLTDAFFDAAEVRHGDRVIRKGRPPLEFPKELISLRLDQDVLQRLRSLGPGWQSRVNEALRQFVEELEKP